MGFWDNVGKLAKTGAQAGAKMASDTYGDMKEAQADAARQELKSRGYSDDAIQSLVNRHR